ncbi:MAG: adenosine deaminase [Lachnospiraceae bacterium]|nr:adenosine deaminase [Lachnospiraceae bacterium]
MESFTDALKQRNLEKIRVFPKSDLHNHFVLGGSRQYLREITGIRIEPVKAPLSSMDEMHAWNRENLGERFETSVMRKLLIRAAFHQAREDGITVLEIGEDVWGLSEFFHNDIDELIEAFTTAQREIAPNIKLRLQIGLSRHCPIEYLEDCLSHFWGNTAFYSIDLYGDEFAQPIENFKSIYRRAKKEGLCLKAHVGEWGSAEDVRRAVEELELHEVQHGISATQDESVVRFLADHHIRLNITPSSNVLLGRVPSMSDHPIGRLYRSGVDVTINSDDILIFNSDVSKEYLRLYESGCLSAEELDSIRQSGLTIRRTENMKENGKCIPYWF